jgi:hypothetical protein
MTLGGAIQDIQDRVLAAAIAPAGGAPDYPTEAVGPTPYCLAFPSDIDCDLESGWATGPQEITVLIMWTRQDLALVCAAAEPVGQTFVKTVFADPSLSGTVADVTHIHGTFGKIAWEDDSARYIGWNFKVTVTLLDKL